MRVFELSAVHALIVLLGADAASARANETVTSLDDFDGGVLAPWTFDNGAEFPGARGSLTLDAGANGTAAFLAYDFSDGGAYVSANLTLISPVVADAIGMQIAAPLTTGIGLRVVDSTGQTLQYSLQRPLPGSGQWYSQVFELATPDLTYGGANDGVLHSPVTRLSILANAPAFLASRVGAVAFDNVVAISDLGYALDPLSTVDFPAAAAAADCRANAGVNIHFTSDPAALDAAADAGLAFVRMDLFWSDVEVDAGTYDFSNYDTLLSELTARGMGALFILDYGTTLYANANPPSDPAAVAHFAAFAEAAAAHFAGQPVRFEVWNEENGVFWSPAPDAGQYADLCAAAIAAVHRANPVAEVSTGGLSGYDFHFLVGMLDAGAAVGANAVGVHPYRVNGPETETNDLFLMRSLVAPLPTWQTEWGYSATWYLQADAGVDGGLAGAEQRQGIYAGREALASCALQVPLNVYYDLRDDGTDPTNEEDNFGLLAHDDSPKPAFLEIQSALQAMKGRTFQGMWSTSPTNLNALKFVGPSDSVVVLWVDDLGGSVQVTSPAPLSAVDGLGDPLTSMGIDGGLVAWRVSESEGPIYLRFALAPTDGGVSPDAGADAGAAVRPDAGVSAGADAGTDAGGGVTDAGTAVDGGMKQAVTGGCGCSERGSEVEAGAWLALALLCLKGRRPGNRLAKRNKV